MTAQQVKATRAAINAAHAASDTAEAARLQGQLHAHFVAESDAFLASAEGAAHMDRLLNKFD